MKKMICVLLMCCLLLCGMAMAEENIPDAVLAPLQSRFDAGYEIAAYYYHPGNSRAHFVLSRNGRNQLAIVKKTDGGYELELLATNAVRQGNEIPVLETDEFNALYLIYRYEDGREDNYIYEYDWSGTGKWMLSSYVIATSRNNWHSFSCLDGQLVYAYSEDLAVKRSANVYGEYQREVKYLNVEALPETLQEAREKLSQPPEIPEGGLTAQEIKFTSGKKYAVYSGPGEDYLRAANGKAAASTNDWIQVFGTDGDWVLIQYDISANQMRFGYIQASALPKNAQVEELAFQPVSAYTTRRATLTDDPLNTQCALTTLPEGAWVTWLATMGEWAYVESTTGDAMRGFVPVSVLSTDRVFNLADHQWNENAAAVAGSLTVRANGQVTLLVEEWRADSAGRELAGFIAYNETTMEQLLIAEYDAATGCCAGQGMLENGWSVLICPVYADGSVDTAAGLSIQW